MTGFLLRMVLCIGRQGILRYIDKDTVLMGNLYNHGRVRFLELTGRTQKELPQLPDCGC